LAIADKPRISKGRRDRAFAWIETVSQPVSTLPDAQKRFRPARANMILSTPRPAEPWAGDTAGIFSRPDAFEKRLVRFGRGQKKP
jgi:hypothetical protein